jgi:hypothetical protein
MDKPEDLVAQGIARHVQMISQLKGVPGVLPVRR